MTHSSKFALPTHALKGVSISGTGSYVPDRIVTNEELQKNFGFDPDWIVRRTGIQERRHAAPEQATSDLCIEAAVRAMNAADAGPNEIDLLIVGTFTPDFQLPSVANIVQDRLDLRVPAIELHAGCSGFMYGMVTAAQFIATDNARCALVIGGDCGSRVCDPSDQKIAPILSDGAGAIILRKGSPQQGFLAYQMGSDGSGSHLITRRAGGSRLPSTKESIAAGDDLIQMDGKKVFKWAVNVVIETTQLVVKDAGLRLEDVDVFLFHQANVRILQAISEELQIPMEKVFSNVQKYGNTAAASIPLVLDEAKAAGMIKPGSKVLMSGFGSGLSWCTGLFRF